MFEYATKENQEAQLAEYKQAHAELDRQDKAWDLGIAAEMYPGSAAPSASVPESVSFTNSPEEKREFPLLMQALDGMNNYGAERDNAYNLAGRWVVPRGRGVGRGGPWGYGNPGSGGSKPDPDSTGNPVLDAGLGIGEHRSPRPFSWSNIFSVQDEEAKRESVKQNTNDDDGSRKKDPEDCDPPAGTQCWDLDIDKTRHKTKDMFGSKLGEKDTHAHLYQMNKAPKGCTWNRTGKNWGFDYVSTEMAPCSSYPSWRSQVGK